MRRGLVGFCMLAVACNAILGIEDREPRPDDIVEAGAPGPDSSIDAPAVDSDITNPSFSVSTSAISLSAPGEAGVVVTVTRNDGFAEPIAITFEPKSLPTNVTATTATETGQGQVTIQVSAKAPPDVTYLGTSTDAYLRAESTSGVLHTPKVSLTIASLVWSTPTATTWIPTADLASIRVEAWGAGGGGFGGAGSFAAGTVPITKNATHYLVVGTRGHPSLGSGFGGGAFGAINQGYPGGGYSGFFGGPTATRASALVVAGGGGGEGEKTVTDVHGGAGDQDGFGPVAGKRGTTAGGGNYGWPGAEQGSALQGGRGYLQPAGNFGTGGHGGGGYSGGGGGGPNDAGGGGGGGGSSFVSDAAANPVIDGGNRATPGNAGEPRRKTAGNPQNNGLVILSVP